MNTADLYLRLSLDFVGATSIDRQEADCRRWCASNGLAVRQVHIDRGVSGFAAHAQRDGFEAALSAVSEGAVSTLVVWKLDRLSRRGIGQVGQLLDRFESAGGRLVSVQDQLDTAQPQARMIIALLSEFARSESETMGVRIKSAKEAHRASGIWLSGKPPFGYAIAPDRRLTPVEPAATMMRQVFERLVAGHSLVATCRWLNDQGARNSRGNAWRDSALSSAITTPAYAGLTPARHVNSNGGHAAGKPEIYRDPDTGLEVSCLTAGARPIVSRAVQLAAFEVLRTRLRRYGRGNLPKRPPHALLLRGLGRCAGCDQPLVTHNGYRCRRFDRGGNLACDRPANGTVRAVDREVAMCWQRLIVSGGPGADDVRGEVMRRWSVAPKRLTGRSRLQAELDDLQARLHDADAAFYVRGDLDASRHASVVKLLSRRIARAQAVLADAAPATDITPLTDPLFVAARWEVETSHGRQDLLRMAWSKVTLAKSASRGGQFDPGRITYTPV